MVQNIPIGEARHRITLLLCILNDGAYGAKIHKLRAADLSRGHGKM
jgi:hypothetical protein